MPLPSVVDSVKDPSACLVMGLALSGAVSRAQASSLIVPADAVLFQERRCECGDLAGGGESMSCRYGCQRGGPAAGLLCRRQPGRREHARSSAHPVS